MSRMSEVHQDLESIHQILLGQRKIATLSARAAAINADVDLASFAKYLGQVECIDNLLLEFEAAGVVWPDNVVQLEVNTHLDNTWVKKCGCNGDIHPEHGPNC